MSVEKHSTPTPTMDRTGKRRWLYPDRRDGKYASRRRSTAIALLVIYIVTPWLTWNGLPLVQLDVITKKAYFFGVVLRLNEASILAPFLAMMAIILLLATLLRGRIWCSHACPQTVFVEWVIRPIEELIEGNAHHRRRMDAGPMTWSLRLRKVAKHALFLLVAFVVANTFVAYFVGTDRLIGWMRSSPFDHPTPFLCMAAVLGVFYGDLAWFREQFCAYLCPYARFQSVMLDADTPTVTYDEKRGDPRGRGTGKGDCIDCHLCVRVCPTGIDIRDGLQLECVMCSRCIDACNMVMTNLNRPEGLIRVTSQNALHGLRSAAFWRRPKVVAYSFAVTLLLAAVASRIVLQPVIGVTVVRAPGSTYTQMPDGHLGNMFLFNLVNNTNRPLLLDLQPATSGVSLLCAQCQTELAPFAEVRASAIVSFDPALAGQTVKIAGLKSGVDIEVPLIGP